MKLLDEPRAREILQKASSEDVISMGTECGGTRQTIVETINKVRTDLGRDKLAPDDDDALMGELGLDSLDLAVLVVSLEKALGVDPFREGSESARTLGELVSVYEKALAS